jgi:polysaccharide export outer membrane protein
MASEQGLAFLVAGGLCLALPSNALAQSDAAAAAALADEANYRIGSGDELQITVYGSADPAVVAIVDEDGTITVPLLGRVGVGGLTRGEAARQLANLYRAGLYYRNPQVSVQILQYRSNVATVTGYVARPGRYILTRDRGSVTEVVGQAGGIQPNGSSRATVIRTVNGVEQRLTVDVGAILQGLAPDFVLQPGDRVLINAAQRFFIRGAVQRPGSFEVEPGLTIGQALALGGGLTDRGTDRKVRVYRVINGVRTKYRAALGDAVRQGDELVVGERLF